VPPAQSLGRRHRTSRAGHVPRRARLAPGVVVGGVRHKPIDLFHWFEDGELRTMFESPRWREGSTPDDLIPLLRDVGLPLTLEGEYDDSASDVDRKAAVLALAERLTGVRVTASLLADASYELGLVPDQFARSKHFGAAKPQQPR
jgi:hypothetical protein